MKKPKISGARPVATRFRPAKATAYGTVGTRTGAGDNSGARGENARRPQKAL